MEVLKSRDAEVGSGKGQVSLSLCTHPGLPVSVMSVDDDIMLLYFAD